MRSGIGRLSLTVGLCLVLAAAFPAGLQAKVFNVNTRVDAVDDNPGNGKCRTAAGKCSLRAAVMEANALAGADEIVLLDKVYILTIAGPSENTGAVGDLDILEDLTITGAGRNKTFVDGNQIDRVFQVRPGVDKAVFDGLTIQNGLTSGNGAGIFNEGSRLVLTGSAVRFNIVRNDSTTAQGGGIANVDDGSVILRGSRVAGNMATGMGSGLGGGIHSEGGLIKIIGSSVSNNAARGWSGGRGGGIYGSQATIKLLNKSKVNYNLAVGDNNTTGNGGGIYNIDGPVTIRNSAVSHNLIPGEYSGYGGGVYTTQGQLKIIGSRIKDNSITGANNGTGGGVYSLLNSLCLIRNSAITGNTAGSTSRNSGGGIYNSVNDLVKILNSRISGNMALSTENNSNGGGLYNMSEATIEDSLFLNNHAGSRAESRGGAIYNLNLETMTLRGVTLSGNSASGSTGWGGGIYTSVASFLDILDGSRITGNMASDDGGGIYSDTGATLVVSPDSTVKKNIPNNTN